MPELAHWIEAEMLSATVTVAMSEDDVKNAHLDTLEMLCHLEAVILVKSATAMLSEQREFCPTANVNVSVKSSDHVAISALKDLTT